MAARTIDGIPGLKELVGEHLGYSDYLEITQERVNPFADATGDHQWIHVDVERAKAGPVRRPDRPRLPHAVARARRWPRRSTPCQGINMGVNYGAARSGSPPRCRSARSCGSAPSWPASRTSPAAAQVTMEFTFEVEGAPKPSCVAEVIFRYY